MNDVTGNRKQHEANCIARAPPVKRCQAINSNLESDWTRPNPVAKTTRMHGHQTPLSLGLWGVACETNPDCRVIGIGSRPSLSEWRVSAQPSYLSTWMGLCGGRGMDRQLAKPSLFVVILVHSIPYDSGGWIWSEHLHVQYIIMKIKDRVHKIIVLLNLWFNMFNKLTSA